MTGKGKITVSDDYVAAHARDIGKLLKRAVDHALLMHKRLGNPIASWKDRKVVIIPPEEIVLSPDVDTTKE